MRNTGIPRGRHETKSAKGEGFAHRMRGICHLSCETYQDEGELQNLECCCFRKAKATVRGYIQDKYTTMNPSTRTTQNRHRSKSTVYQKIDYRRMVLESYLHRIHWDTYMESICHCTHRCQCIPIRNRSRMDYTMCH